jgi:hypothetical protein
MADEIAKLGVVVVANDQTGKGFDQVEKRAKTAGKRIGEVGRNAFNDNDRRVSNSTKAMVGSFARIEQAAAKALGGKSMTSGVAGRLGAVTQAAASMGDGLAGAATAGSALASAVGTVGVVAGAAVAVVGALAYKGYEMADAWMKGASAIGRTAKIMGVSTKTLQEFSAAAERVGVDKQTAQGALGGLSQTLNDARYGRNTGALEAVRRLGITMRTKNDGTVDVDAMLPDIATAIARQNSSGRRTASNLLGIPLQALPAFMLGGAGLSAKMKDASKTAPVASDKDTADADRIYEKRVRLGQLEEKGEMVAGRKAARAVGEPILDGLLKAGNAINNGGSVLDEAAHTLDRAANKMLDAVEGPRIGSTNMRRSDIGAHAANAAGFRNMLMNSFGLSQHDATALATNAELESGMDPHKVEKNGGPGRGLFQITDPARRALFIKQIGKAPESASMYEQAKFAVWELRHSEAKNWSKVERLPDNSAQRSAGYGELVMRPKDRHRRGEEAALIGAAMDRIPVHLNIRFENAPPGTTAKATSRGNVSMAHQH